MDEFIISGQQRRDVQADIIPPGYAMQIDEVDSSTTYLGLAKSGTPTSQALWQIRKIAVSGTVTSFTWADGDASYNHVWDNRTSLTYS
jgi:hypothetical protein